MNTLPIDFPQTDSDTEMLKVQWFFRRYVEEHQDQYQFGHFLLAAYAAVPAYLTPDLLYKIWLNFHGYRWTGKPVSIHRVAVSDIILSPLVREVGFEIFEMNHEIRLAMLKWLRQAEHTTIWQKRGVRKIGEVAAFVHQYHEIPSAAGQRWGTNYTESQLEEALIYTSPEKVIHSLFEKLNRAATGNRETEMLQSLDAIVKTHQKLEQLGMDDQFDRAVLQKQTMFMNAWKSLIQKNNTAFIEELFKNEDLKNLLSEINNGGIPVKMPGGVAKKLELSHRSNVYALVIGIGQVRPVSPQEYGTLEGENDAMLFSSCLEEIIPAERLKLTVLTGKETTKAGILSSLSGLQEKATENDVILVYISSNATSGDNNCYIICYDSADMSSDPSMETFLSDKEFYSVTRESKAELFTAILEVPFSGAGSWRDMMPMSHNIVFTSCAKDQVPRYSERAMFGEKYYSFFTHVLVNVLKRNRGEVSARQLFTQSLSDFEQLPQVKEIYGTEQRKLHRPQLFATPATLNRTLFALHRRAEILQDYGRKAGISIAPVTGRHNEEFRKMKDSWNTLFPQTPWKEDDEVLPLLEKFVNDTSENQIPAFVFIFSDTQKNLSELNHEKEEIQTLSSSFAQRFSFEMKIFSDPLKKDLIEWLSLPENRGRVHLFYFSGMDDSGDMVLADGKLTIADMSLICDYQENIRLLVSNTCRSMYFAEYASQLGVAMAIGVDDLIMDDKATWFGTNLVNAVFNEEDLQRFVDNTF